MGDHRQLLARGGEALARGGEALARGDWAAARQSFEEALELGGDDSGQALLGAGTAAWWLGETDLAVRYQERAYAAFCRRSDPASAAQAALALCLLYRASLGNYAASRGWLERLARLVDELALDAFAGWVALCRAVTANDGSDPAAAERCAREAYDIARRAGDADVALCALAELGTALVQKGQVAEGAPLLDEAMAAALAGEARRPETVVLIGCRTITCCSRAAEIARAVQWIRAAGDFTRRYGGLHLYTTCRVCYGGILLATGKWAEAEQELTRALAAGKLAERSLCGEAHAKLAELRLAQGRIDDAAALLAGFEDHLAAAYPLAAIHLCRGEPAAAAMRLRRRLDDAGDDCVEVAAVLELFAEAEVAAGDAARASALAERLAALADRGSCALVRAYAERAAGRALAARGDRDGAIPHLEAALRGFAGIDMPLEVGRCRVLLARVLGEGAREAAVAEARVALARFEALGAARDADATAALLRSFGATAARSGPKGVGRLTKRELEVLSLLAEGLSNRALAERLFISPKTAEHHVRKVLAKLGLSNRAEAAAYAVRHL